MEQLIGITARDITLVNHEAPARFGPQVRRIPAGTEVYATALRTGLRIRLPHTLFTQDVEADAVRVP